MDNNSYDSYENLKKTLIKHNQEHLLEFINSENDEDKKQRYKKQLEGIDYEMIKKLNENILLKDNKIPSFFKDEDFSRIDSSFIKENLSGPQYNYSFQLGLEKIYEGKVALLILAGGQGSRLGLEKPKGMFNIQMPMQKLAKNKINSKTEIFKPSTLLIMTSVENHIDTIEFFQQNNYFNLNPDDIIFFEQDTLPAIDSNGRIIKKDLDQIFLAPNGNGGCFISLKKNKIIEKFLDRGIEYINVISVDNPLSITLDPLFVGLTYSQEYQMAAKTIKKNSASESIGVFLNLLGKPTMMDYMEIPKHLTELIDKEGNLIYRGGNILNYLIGVKILNEILLDENKYQELINEFHVSYKKIQGIVLNENFPVYRLIDGVKFELFFNSIFKFADSKGLLLLEVNRDEFAPVKNDEKSLNDNPRTARDLMVKTFLEWYVKSGGIVNLIEEDNRNLKLEISYLLSFNGENLVPGKNIPKNIDNNKSYYFY